MQSKTYHLRYVPFEDMFHKTQQMCDEAVVRDDGTLKFVPDDYKTQKMCHKAVDNYGDATK